MSIDILLEVVAAAAALDVVEAMPDMAILMGELMMLTVYKKESLVQWRISKMLASATRGPKTTIYIRPSKAPPVPSLDGQSPQIFCSLEETPADFPCKTCGCPTKLCSL